MIDFSWHVPTKAGDAIRSRGIGKVLVHFGGGSAVKSGLLDRVKASLDAAGIARAR